MAWPKGKPKSKTGGRKKGTPNKRTLALQELLEAEGVDVVERLCSIILGGRLEPKDQAYLLMDLMAYLYPKRKPLETPDEKDPSGVEVYATEWG